MSILFCFWSLYVIITIIRVNSCGCITFGPCYSQRQLGNGMMCVCVCLSKGNTENCFIMCNSHFCRSGLLLRVYVFCSSTPKFYHARGNIYLTIIERVLCIFYIYSLEIVFYSVLGTYLYRNDLVLFRECMHIAGKILPQLKLSGVNLPFPLYI